mgnify:CR=1 FL=1
MRILEMIKTICAKYINEEKQIEYLPIFYIAGSQTLPPPLDSKEEEELIKKLLSQNIKKVKIAKMLNVDYTTLYKYLKEKAV